MKKPENHWMSISDLMSGLMIVFMFVAIAFMIQVQEQNREMNETINQYAKIKHEIYLDLYEEFKGDLPNWDAVLAFIPNRYRKVIEQTSVYIHCAEIPEVMCRRATNRELAKWLVLGNGQYQVSGGRIWTEHHYDIGQDDDACSKFILVRKWDDTEWHKPTREYLGLED